MSPIVVNQYVERVDPFYVRGDVVPNYRLIRRGSMSLSFDNFAYRVSVYGEDFVHYQSRSWCFEYQPATC